MFDILVSTITRQSHVFKKEVASSTVTDSSNCSSSSCSDSRDIFASETFDITLAILQRLFIWTQLTPPFPINTSLSNNEQYKRPVFNYTSFPSQSENFLTWFAVFRLHMYKENLYRCYSPCSMTASFATIHSPFPEVSSLEFEQL